MILTKDKCFIDLDKEKGYVLSKGKLKIIDLKSAKVEREIDLPEEITRVEIIE